ncbi:hypothetical protein C4K23_3024 [Pseudomonas chlororaphis]|nr:hypothetical protein C4K23_3024 [Pseudomonas chlororaphis]ETD40687.1 hypothetical protein U724_03165 [Pseudomonas chlororaphis subsp. aurantiaca PB-St2]
MTHASAGQASPLAHTLDTSSPFLVISPGLAANSNVLAASPARGAEPRLYPRFLTQGGASQRLPEEKTTTHQPMISR